MDGLDGWDGWDGWILLRTLVQLEHLAVLKIWHAKRTVIVTQRPCCLFLAAVSLLGLHTGFSLSGKTKFNVNDQNRQTILKSFKSVYQLCPTVIKSFQYCYLVYNKVVCIFALTSS